MDKIAVLIPSVGDATEAVSSPYAAEYEACSEIDLFYPVLYNERTLTVSQPAPVKSMDALRRGRNLNAEREPGDFWTGESWAGRSRAEVDAEHELKRQGYRLAFSGWNSRRPDFPDDVFRPSEHLPERMQPYHRYYRRFAREYGWFPDLYVFDEVLPAVAKSPTGVLKDESGGARVFERLGSWAEVEGAISTMSSQPLERYTDTIWEAPMWFERRINIARVGGVPVEWRVFYYERRVVYAAPKPKVPEGLVLPSPLGGFAGKPLEGTEFTAVDLALDVAGKWWVLSSGPGEGATIPAGGNAREFYRRLAEEIRRGPDVPAWCWGLAADVIGSHSIGTLGTSVPGSRHFAPGTKVWVASRIYWDLSSERRKVVGIPKYCDHLVAVIMRDDYLTDFRLERIEDPDVVRALMTGRTQEWFERGTCLTGIWSQSDKDRREIEELAEYLNQRPSDR